MHRHPTRFWVMLLLTCSALPIDAAPTHDWSKSIGVHSVAHSGAVAVDHLGNAFATGDFEGSVDFGGAPIHCAGLGGVFLVKYDANGSHLWSRGFGDESYAKAKCVAVDPLGNVLITGHFNETIDFGGGLLMGIGPGDLFLAKFDGEGNHLWSQRFGDGNYQYDWWVTADNSGNVLLVGNSCCSIDFGGGLLTSNGRDDVFVAKLDPDGNHLWSQRFGDAGHQRASAIATDTTGNIVITGSFEDGIDFGVGLLTSAGSQDIFVAKFDTDGHAIWSRRFGDNYHQRAESIATDGAGNVALTGSYKGDVDFGGGGFPAVYDHSGFVAVLDVDGDEVWSRRFEAENQNYVLGKVVTATASGKVVVSGNFGGSADFGGGTTTSMTGDSPYVASFDVDGEHLWSRIFESSDYLGVTSLALNDAGDVLLSGRLLGIADLGGAPLTTGITEDAFVAKLDSDGTHVWSHDMAQLSGYGGRTKVAVDGAGNLALSGFFDGTLDVGTGPLTNLESTDTFVARFDSDGNALWSRSIGDGYLYSYLGVKSDALGNVVAAGSFDGVVDLGGGPLSTAGGSDVYLAKFDPDGNSLWGYRFGDEDEQYGFDTTVDPLGNVFVTGWFRGTLDFGGAPIVGTNDVFLAKFNPDGEQLWSRSFGADNTFQAGHFLATDSDGNVVVAGFNDGSVDFGGGLLSGDFDFFVAKFDPDGNHLWSRNFGDGARPYIEGLAIDDAGNVVVTGSYFGSMDLGGGPLPSAGDRDVFLASFDPDGNHRFSRRFGDAEEQLGSAVAAVHGSENVVVTGQFEGTLDFGGSTLSSTGDLDIFVASFDGSGNVLWSRRFGDESVGWATDIATDAQGGFTIAGYLEGPVDFGGGLVRASARGNPFLARFQESGVPVRFARFEATLQQHAVRLGWDVRSDDARERFVLLRWDEAHPQAIAIAQGPLIKSEPHYLDTNVEPARSYHYQMIVHTPDGAELRSEIVSLTTPALRTMLSQNTPNPFNPKTVIEYTLGERAKPRLNIYDAAGKLVVRLARGLQEPGAYRVEWDGRDGDGRELPSGVYYYRLEGVRGLPTRKMLLLR